MLGLFRMHHSYFCALAFLHEWAKVGPVHWSCVYGTPALTQIYALCWLWAGATSASRPAHLGLDVWRTCVLDVRQTWAGGVFWRELRMAHVKWECAGSALVSPAHLDQHTMPSRPLIKTHSFINPYL